MDDLRGAAADAGQGGALSTIAAPRSNTRRCPPLKPPQSGGGGEDENPGEDEGRALATPEVWGAGGEDRVTSTGTELRPPPQGWGRDACSIPRPGGVRLTPGWGGGNLPAQVLDGRVEARGEPWRKKWGSGKRRSWIARARRGAAAGGRCRAGQVPRVGGVRTAAWRA